MAKLYRFLLPLLVLTLASCASLPKPEPVDLSNWPKGPLIEGGLGTEGFGQILKPVSNGDSFEALKLTEKALTTYPDEPHLHLLKAKLLQATQGEQEALDYLSDQIAARPGSGAFYSMRGLLLFSLGYLESARADFNQAEGLGHSSLEQSLALAEVLEQAQLPSASLAALVKATKLAPKRDDLWFRQAQFEFRLGRIQNAQISILKVIELAPDNLDYQQFYVDFLDYTGQKGTWGAQLESLNLRFPNHPWFTLRLGNYLISRGEINQAKQLILKAIDKHPDNYMLHFQIATIHLAEKDFDLAQDHFKKGLASKPDSTLAMVQIARIYLAKDEMQNAVDMLEQARAAGSEDLFVYETLARIYNQRLDSFEAERVIVEGLNLKGDSVALLLEYGALLERRRQYPEALMAFEAALVEHPTSNYILGRMGNLYRILKDYPKAIDFLNRAAESSPDSSWVLAHQVELYQELKDWPKALKTIETMIEGDQSSYWPFAKRAMIYLHQDQYAEAEKAIGAAIMRNPEAKWLREFEGQILASLGRHQEAAKSFETALSGDRDNAFLLVRLAYSKVHFDRAGALEAVTQALDLEDFSLAGLELYLYLNGQTTKTWGFKPDSPEMKVFEAIVFKSNQARQELNQLKSPYKPYLAFFMAVLDQGAQAKLEGYKSSPLGSGAAWMSFYQAVQAQFLEKPLEVKAHLLEANIQEPGNLWVQARLAYAHELAGEYPQAIELLKIHLENRPQSLWAKLRLALNYDMNQQGVESEKVYKQILNEHPDEHIALNNLAWLYVTSKNKELNKLDDALGLSIKAVALSPSSANLDTLAEIYFLKKDYKKALKTIERALDQDREALDYFKKQKKKILKALQVGLPPSRRPEPAEAP